MNVAMVVGERSLCDRDKVGAVIVSNGNRIVDTGYNGPPRGMPRVGLSGSNLSHSDEGCVTFCKRALMAQMSTDHGLALDYTDCPSLHAEANALMFSDRRLREGGTIYVSSGVCGGCAKLIANSGLTRVVCDVTHLPPHRSSDKWFEWMRTCGIIVEEMTH